jgi:hypothetical protein
MSKCQNIKPKMKKKILSSTTIAKKNINTFKISKNDYTQINNDSINF